MHVHSRMASLLQNRGSLVSSKNPAKFDLNSLKSRFGCHLGKSAQHRERHLIKWLMKILKAAFFSFQQQHQPLDEAPSSNPAEAVTETELNEIVFGFAFFNIDTAESD